MFSITNVVRYKGTICTGVVESAEIKRGDKVYFNNREGRIFGIEDRLELVESALKGQSVSILIPNWADVDIKVGDCLMDMPP